VEIVGSLQSRIVIPLSVVVILVAAFRLDRLQNIVGAVLLATQLVKRLLLDYVWAVGDHASRRLQGAGLRVDIIITIDIAVANFVHLVVALWQFGKSLQAFLWCDHDRPTKLLTLVACDLQVTALLASDIATIDGIVEQSCWDYSRRVKWASFKLVR